MEIEQPESTLTPEASALAEGVKPAPASAVDLDVFLREYQEQTSAQSAAPAVQRPEPVSAPTQEQQDALRDLSELRQWAEGIEYDRLAKQEDDDSEAVFKEAQGYLEGVDHLPEDFARRWLTSEYAIDPELHHAWNNRYASPEAMQRCTAAIRRACYRMQKQVRAMPNPDATADRAAVVEAMTRGRSSGTIEAKAPDLSRMSDQEFAKYKEGLGL